MSEIQNNKNKKRISRKVKETIGGITLAAASMGIVGANLPSGERPTLGAAVEVSASENAGKSVSPSAEKPVITPEMIREAEQVRESLTAYMTDLAEEARAMGAGATANKSKGGGIYEKLSVGGLDHDKFYVGLLSDEEGNLVKYGLNKVDTTNNINTEYWVSPQGFGIDVTTNDANGRVDLVRSTSYNLEETSFSYRSMVVGEDDQSIHSHKTYSATLENYTKAVSGFQEELDGHLIEGGIRAT